MEYYPFQHQDQTNSELLYTQECTHMNKIVGSGVRPSPF